LNDTYFNDNSQVMQSNELGNLLNGNDKKKQSTNARSGTDSQ